jgi:hypothetical protein
MTTIASENEKREERKKDREQGKKVMARAI